MTATPEPLPLGNPPKNETFRDSLVGLDRILGAAPVPESDLLDYAVLEDELRKLHARFRAHQATDFFNPQKSPAWAAAPQLGSELTQLSNEHPRILGMLDWVMRRVGTMADRPAEDRDVFLFRLFEIIAVLRRHEAEENRLFLIAHWQDTGGES